MAKCSTCGFRNCICAPQPKWPPPGLSGSCPICGDPYPCLKH